MGYYYNPNDRVMVCHPQAILSNPILVSKHIKSMVIFLDGEKIYIK